MFEARRLIEPGVLRRLIETLTPEKLARLRQHQCLELDARRCDDKRAVIRLSSEFHSLAAELAGTSALARNMRELSVLTCLMIFFTTHRRRRAAAPPITRRSSRRSPSATRRAPSG